MLLYHVFCILFFFFFQAEDGIRDGRVTGVQTCALPIYLGCPCLLDYPQIGADQYGFYISANEFSSFFGSFNDSTIIAISKASRSEERRVGKECRSRWSRDH